MSKPDAEIEAGPLLHVQAGGDAVRRLPYYCRVIEVYSVDGNGWYHVRVQPCRANGTPGVRYGKVRPPKSAILIPAKVTRKPA
jgi:hypothetical protein